MDGDIHKWDPNSSNDNINEKQRKNKTYNRWRSKQ